MRHAKPLRWLTVLTAFAILTSAAPAAFAVPSFARQTGMACEACHTVYPELTHFGRVFKANGYMLTNLKQVRGVSGKKEELLALSQTPPLSIMVQISDTQLKRLLPDVSNPAAPGPGAERHRRVSAAGRPVLRRQDRAEFRRVPSDHLLQQQRHDRRSTIPICGSRMPTVLPDNSPLTYGVSLNNNPTVQDLWNTTPAFGFPFAAATPPYRRWRIRHQRDVRAERRGPDGVTSSGTSHFTPRSVVTARRNRDRPMR